MSATQLLPLETLPKYLYKQHQQNQRWLPPVFRFAFAVTLEWAAAYATKHDLVENSPEMDLDDEDAEPELFSVEAEVGCPLEKIVDHINANSGVGSPKITREHIFPYPCIVASQTYYWLICLRSNYDDGPLPAVSDVKRLQEYLELKDPPAWHLDMQRCVWKKVF